MLFSRKKKRKFIFGYLIYDLFYSIEKHDYKIFFQTHDEEIINFLSNKKKRCIKWTNLSFKICYSSLEKVYEFTVRQNA